MRYSASDKIGDPDSPLPPPPPLSPLSQIIRLVEGRMCRLGARWRNRHSQIVFLPRVRSVSSAAVRKPSRIALHGGAGLEPNPRGNSQHPTSSTWP